MAENFLGANARLQPFIHNVPVTVEERGKVYHFMVFFKRHRYFTAEQGHQAPPRAKHYACNLLRCAHHAHWKEDHLREYERSG